MVASEIILILIVTYLNQGTQYYEPHRGQSIFSQFSQRIRSCYNLLGSCTSCTKQVKHMSYRRVSGIIIASTNITRRKFWQMVFCALIKTVNVIFKGLLYIINSINYYLQLHFDIFKDQDTQNQMMPIVQGQRRPIKVGLVQFLVAAKKANDLRS